MRDSDSWPRVLRCPDCHGAIDPCCGNDDSVQCSRCARYFEKADGIWDLLPSRVINRRLKDKEKQGWTQKAHDSEKKGWDPPPAHFLALPDHPHPYYQAAKWYMKIVLAHGRPWDGKKVLELGAAECWGTRAFAEAGADAAALDYDPTRMKKGQILLDHLPIHFSRFTGDAEELPFADNCLDAVFCCSVLHHFFDLSKAIGEISRTLKPGGVFYGIHEAFHPPYYSPQQILAMADDTIPNIEAGINERSYPLSTYRRWFINSGMRFQAIHPRWDVKADGDGVDVSAGINIRNPDFAPVSLTARAGLDGVAGSVSRWLLKTRLWKVPTHRSIFPLIRFQILNWTTKDKIIIATKSAR